MQEGRGGFSSDLNRGYNEQPAINWGKMGLYTAGAAAAYGVIRAGALSNTTQGILGKNMVDGWEGYKKLGAQVTESDRARIRGRLIGKAQDNARKSFTATTTPDEIIQRMAEATNRYMPEGAAANEVDAGMEALKNKRAMSLAQGGIESAFNGAKAFFGAADFADASGMKRFGIGAARVGVGLGALKIGSAALNYLNPFGD